MQFTDFWIGKIQADNLPEAIDAAGLIKYLSVFTSDEQCFHIIYQWHETTLKRTGDWWFPRQELFKLIQSKVNKKGRLTETLMHCLVLLDTSEKKRVTVAEDRVNIQIDIMMHGGPEQLVSRRDALGILVIEFLSNIKSTRQRDYWSSFIDHCLTAGDVNAPHRKWWKRAKELVDRIEPEQFIARLRDWISFCQGQLMSIHSGRKQSFTDYDIDYLSAINHNLLKALIWCSAIPDNKTLLDLLDTYIPWAYKRKGSSGPLSVKTGTACMYAYTFLSFREALTRIARFRGLVRHSATQKSIDKILHGLAQQHEIPPHQLEEYIVPDFGLDQQGMLRVSVGEMTGVYSLQDSGKLALYLEKDGTQLPAVLPATNPALKDFKKLAREIDDTLSASCMRLERSFLRQHPWSYTHWKAFYLDHPLVRNLTTRLIWNFSTNGIQVAGYYYDGNIVDYKGKRLVVSEETQVSLWHPMNGSMKTVKAWRNFLSEHHVAQPFEQVNRVTYTPTPDELTDGYYSSRFACQVLNRDKFRHIISQRGWTLRQKAAHNWSYVPHMALMEWDIRVNFFADKKEEDTVVTDLLNFYREGVPLALCEVPPVVFSEMIRDVSLFVAIAGTTELHNR
ncbi:DUF4132 domain-containing protein [Chitinophaga agri]|uniref:DUF4132 domain-containing protein n=1 Tax=Chitinophaga agri TaxID=2703787 RepID=A0A6B9Z912_9BACT|nr:DUF4132 domain-containing protein [Chitinophaga agri]QHS58738.1 DUF4132 domain-containing protein [Chitinophaga agri]